MKKQKNSRNTNNPYELISGITLMSKRNKHMKLSIYANEYESDGSKNNIIAKSFNVSDLPELSNEKDKGIWSVFKKIRNFEKKTCNPLEKISMFLDAYNANKNYLYIKIRTVPAHPDALDSKFVYDELVNEQ